MLDRDFAARCPGTSLARVSREPSKCVSIIYFRRFLSFSSKHVRRALREGEAARCGSIYRLGNRGSEYKENRWNMRQIISNTERSEIVAALRGGGSQNAVSKQFRRSPSTINRIAQSEGLEYTPPKNINQARRDFSLAEQLELSNQWFAKLGDELAIAEKAKDIRDLSVSLGICYDKRLLLEGRATTRAEIVGNSGGSAIERLKVLLGHNDDNDGDGDD